MGLAWRRRKAKAKRRKGPKERRENKQPGGSGCLGVLVVDGDGAFRASEANRANEANETKYEVKYTGSNS